MNEPRKRHRWEATGDHFYPGPNGAAFSVACSRPQSGRRSLNTKWYLMAAVGIASPRRVHYGRPIPSRGNRATLLRDVTGQRFN
jgi:hypothetical protein